MNKDRNSFSEKVLLFFAMILSALGVVGGLNIICGFFGAPFMWGSFMNTVLGSHPTIFDLFCGLIFTATMVLVVWACFYFLFIPKRKR